MAATTPPPGSPWTSERPPRPDLTQPDRTRATPPRLPSGIEGVAQRDAPQLRSRGMVSAHRGDFLCHSPPSPQAAATVVAR